MEELFLSIVIVTKDDERLADTLGSLSNYPMGCEVVIVNGGSSFDESDSRLLAGLNARVIRDHGQGIYAAMNIGIKNAKGSYIWFVNCGDIVEVPQLHQLVSELTNKVPKSDIVAFRYREWPSNRKRWASRILHPLWFAYGPVCHQAFWISRKSQVSLGLFNENLVFLADRDLLLRILRSGPYITHSSRLLIRWETSGYCTSNLRNYLDELKYFRHSRFTLVERVLGFLVVRIALLLGLV